MREPTSQARARLEEEIFSLHWDRRLGDFVRNGNLSNLLLAFRAIEKKPQMGFPWRHGFASNKHAHVAELFPMHGTMGFTDADGIRNGYAAARNLGNAPSGS